MSYGLDGRTQATAYRKVLQRCRKVKKVLQRCRGHHPLSSRVDRTPTERQYPPHDPAPPEHMNVSRTPFRCAFPNMVNERCS
jgi:hypothetical protein